MRTRPPDHPYASSIHIVPTLEHPPLRILLLDRSRLFAESLRRRLLDEPDVELVGTAVSAPEALRLLSDERFGVVVATPPLAREFWSPTSRRDYASISVTVIVLADAGDEDDARELFGLGVVGWVSRSRSSADLLAAIRTCRRGDVCIPMDVLSALTRQQTSAATPESTRSRVLSVLTPREMQVFDLLEQGKGRAEIAATLHLSPNTVRTHIHRILHRLGVHSTLAALALARAGDLPIS